MFYYAYITWLGFFRPNLFLPNLRFKLVKSGKNQNAGIMGWYEEFLFTAAVVYYLKRANLPHINHHQLSFSPKKLRTSVRLRQKT